MENENKTSTSTSATPIGLRTQFNYSEPKLPIRDRLAMAAMQGELSSQNFEVGAHWANATHLAERAYEVADAMLKQREL